MEDQLQPVQPAEVGESDEKILKKRAKKTGQSPELIELERKQELNFKQAQGLIFEFNKKLQSLGFTLQPVLRYTEFGIKPGNEIRPLSLQEMNQVTAASEQKKEIEPAKEEQPAAPMDIPE